MSLAQDMKMKSSCSCTCRSKCQKARSLIQVVDGQTEMSALHQAAFNGTIPMMHILLDHGAKVDLRDSRGLTPLHVACFQGHFDAVQLLLKWNSDLNMRAHNGLTPMHLACQNGHYDVVKLLLCNNSDVWSRTDDGRTCFDIACEYGRFSIVQLLISMRAGSDLSGIESQAEGDRPKLSCMHLASRNGHIDVLRLLLSQPGVNINRVCDSGTCLHLAVAGCHVGVVKLLLEYGVDPGIVNSFGQTAKDLIHRNTHHSRELNQLLTERLSALNAISIKDFCDIADDSSIAFRAGEHITVLEQGSGKWKGFVTREGMARTGYFPGSCVQLLPDQNFAQNHHTVNAEAQTNTTLHHHQQHHQHHADGLVACPIPHLDSTDMSAGNRNSSASVDSGRGSAHTVASSESSLCRTLPASNGSSCNHNGNGSAHNNCLQTRQSVVSTCSSGSLGSLQDDNSSQGSGNDVYVDSGIVYSPSEWISQGLSASQQVLRFLNAAQFGIYFKNFDEAGYDLPTMIRMTPEDLNAVGLTNPKHRKRLRMELTRLAKALFTCPDYLDPLEHAAESLQLEDSVAGFTRALGLPDTCQRQLENQGFRNLSDLRNLSWEDLEEIGISKLGHQKKLILSVERLRRRDTNNSPSHTLRRTQHNQSSPGSSVITSAIVHPPLPVPMDPLPGTQSPSRSRPVAKILGRPAVVIDPNLLPPPPEPLKTKMKIPPPPPKRSTSVKLSQSPCPSPKRQAPPAYENVSLIENAIRELGSAQARRRPQKTDSLSSIPFANENCGTIRHKPAGLDTVPESTPSPPSNSHTADAGKSSQQKQRESCISNLDDICDMLSDLQVILDKELQEHS